MLSLPLVGRELIGIVEQPGEIHLREVAERTVSDLFQQAADNILGLRLDRRVFLQHLCLGGRKQAVETPQHGQRQDDFAILVTFVGAPEQVANAPDKAGELRVSFCVHS